MLPASPLIDPEPPHNSPAYLSTSCTLPFRYVHCWSNFSQFEILRIRWLTLPHCIKLVDERLFRLWNCEKSGRVCTHTLSFDDEGRKKKKEKKKNQICLHMDIGLKEHHRSTFQGGRKEGSRNKGDFRHKAYGVGITQLSYIRVLSWKRSLKCVNSVRQ